MTLGMLYRALYTLSLSPFNHHEVSGPLWILDIWLQLYFPRFRNPKLELVSSNKVLGMSFAGFRKVTLLTLHISFHHSIETPPSPPPEDLSPVRRRRMRPISEDSEEEVEPQAQRPRIESIPQAPSVEILEEDPEKEDNEMVEQVLQDIMMRRPVTADAFPIARFDAATLQIVPYDPEQKEHSPPITSDPQNIPATDILIPEGTDQSPLDILADAVTQPETNMDQPEEAPLDITEPQTNKDNTSVATEVQTAASDPHTSTTQDFSEEPVTEAEQTNTPAEQINPPSPPATVSDAPQSIILPEYWCHLEILHLQALHLWNPLKTASLPCYASIKFT
ncbi:hypothetical protein ACLB2K_009936 [Fragaria x ananassa]